MKANKLSVSAIHNGTVIDHITAGQAVRIIRLLKFDTHQHRVTIGLNLPTQSHHLKDLIKIEKRQLSPQETQLIALFAPQATINKVENYEVIEKTKVQLPRLVENLLICNNPNCITHHEQVKTIFHLETGEQSHKLRCHYCERSIPYQNIQGLAP